MVRDVRGLEEGRGRRQEAREERNEALQGKQKGRKGRYSGGVAERGKERRALEWEKEAGRMGKQRERENVMELVAWTEACAHPVTARWLPLQTRPLLRSTWGSSAQNRRNRSEQSPFSHPWFLPQFNHLG